MPAPTSDYRAGVELLVGIDKSSYDKSRTRLKQLSDAVDLKIDPATLKSLQEGLRGAIGTADRAVNDVLTKRTDRVFAELMKEYADARSEFIDANQGDEAKQKAFFAAQDTHLSAMLEAEEKAHKMRLEAAEKLKEATTPNAKKFKEASEELGKGFMDAIGKAKSGDLSGLAESFGGALSGMASKKAGNLDLAAKSAGSAEEAATLGAAASRMAIAASAIALVAGALAAIVGLFLAADEQAKEFNKTLLEGAGVADFSFSQVKTIGGQLEDTLDAAQQASVAMAYRWRGQAKDFATMVGALNQAGLTIKEMTEGAQTLDEQKDGIQGYLELTTKWSKAFGLSSAEMAEDIARLSNEFGMTQQAISENYASIATMAQLSGMGTKRFFTAVSQATAGLALYNNRTEEAAELLLLTSKILGGADASDFIKSLTKGFVDESYQDRIKRLMLMGTDSALHRFTESFKQGANDFAKEFQGNKSVQKAFEAVLGKSGVKVDLSPEGIQKTLKSMTQEQIDQVKAGLLKASMRGDETATSALSLLKSINLNSKAMSGDLGDQARAMGELSMGAKLAAKMDNMMGKRLGEMSATDIIAYEQTAGISGEQLKQMQSLDDSLWALYTAQGGSAEDGHEAYMQFISSNEEANKIATDANIDTRSMEEQALYFAKSTTDNTESILSYLKTGIGDVLFRFYSFAIKNDDAAKKMESLLTQTEAARKENADLLGGNKDALMEAQKTLADLQVSTGPDATPQEQAEIAAQEEVVRRLVEAGVALEKRGKELKQGSEDIQMGNVGSDAISTTLYQDNLESGAGPVTPTTGDWLSTAFAVKFPVLAMMFSGNESVPTDMEASPEESSDMASEQMATSEEGVDLSSQQLEVVSGTYDTMDASLSLEQKERKARIQWNKIGYGKATVDAMVAALRQTEAEKLAGQMGLTGKDFDAAVADLLDKGDVTSDALKKVVKDSDTFDKDVVGFGNNLPAAAADFVMRPGQKAQRFSSADTLVGMKEGGPLASMGGGGSQHITINVNGGDPAQVYQTVKSALKNTGART